VFSSVQGKIEAVFFFVELDVGGQDLVGVAAEAGLEYSFSHAAVGNMVRADAESFRGHLFAGFVIQGQPDGLPAVRPRGDEFHGGHHEGNVFHFHRAFLPPDAQEDPAGIVSGQTPTVKKIGPAVGDLHPLVKPAAFLIDLDRRSFHFCLGNGKNLKLFIHRLRRSRR
jgi:hypothetical protein